MAVGELVNRFKMKKHFSMEIDNERFSFARKNEQIAKEAELDGLYLAYFIGPASHAMIGDSLLLQPNVGSPGTALFCGPFPIHQNHPCEGTPQAQSDTENLDGQGIGLTIPTNLLPAQYDIIVLDNTGGFKGYVESFSVAPPIFASIGSTEISQSGSIASVVILPSQMMCGNIDKLGAPASGNCFSSPDVADANANRIPAIEQTEVRGWIFNDPPKSSDPAEISFSVLLDYGWKDQTDYPWTNSINTADLVATSLTPFDVIVFGKDAYPVIHVEANGWRHPDVPPFSSINQQWDECRDLCKAICYFQTRSLGSV